MLWNYLNTCSSWPSWLCDAWSCPYPTAFWTTWLSGPATVFFFSASARDVGFFKPRPKIVRKKDRPRFSSLTIKPPKKVWNLKYYLACGKFVVCHRVSSRFNDRLRPHSCLAISQTNVLTNFLCFWPWKWCAWVPPCIGKRRLSPVWLDNHRVNHRWRLLNGCFETFYNIQNLN